MGGSVVVPHAACAEGERSEMLQGGLSTEDQLRNQLRRLLSGMHRGATVERLRTLMHAGGSTIKKDELVRVLRGERPQWIRNGV